MNKKKERIEEIEENKYKVKYVFNENSNIDKRNIKRVLFNADKKFKSLAHFIIIYKKFGIIEENIV